MSATFATLPPSHHEHHSFLLQDEEDPFKDLLPPSSPYSDTVPTASSPDAYPSSPHEFCFGTLADSGDQYCAMEDTFDLKNEHSHSHSHFESFLNFEPMDIPGDVSPSHFAIPSEVKGEFDHSEICLEQLLDGIERPGPFIGGNEAGFLDPVVSSSEEHMLVESPLSSPVSSSPKSNDVAVVPKASSSLPQANPNPTTTTKKSNNNSKQQTTPPPVSQPKGRITKATTSTSAKKIQAVQATPSSIAAQSAASASNTSTVSPPSSPPSSPESSRSPSPTSFQGTAGLSNKPSKIQIGKGITLELSEEELVSLDIEQIARLAGTKFTKAEEKELKRLRRKSRNKVSAAQSRQKKKDYLSGLEERVETVTTLNVDLKKRLKELEKENSLLKCRLEFLSTHVEPSVRASLPALAINEVATPSTTEQVKESALKAATARNKASAVIAQTTSSTIANSSTSLLTQAHKGKTNSKNVIKSTGVYLMLVFLSFGVFFNVVNRSSSNFSELITSGAQSSREAMISNPIVFNSPLTPAADSSPKSFVFRRMHVYDDPLVDTVPMLDHLEDNTTCSDEKFWDAYYESELQNIDFNERYKNEIILWNECPNVELKHPGSATILDTKVVELDDKSLGLEENIQSIKSELQSSFENVEKVVCTGVACLVRVEHDSL